MSTTLSSQRGNISAQKASSLYERLNELQTFFVRMPFAGDISSASPKVAMLVLNACPVFTFADVHLRYRYRDWSAAVAGGSPDKHWLPGPRAARPAPAHTRPSGSGGAGRPVSRRAAAAASGRSPTG